MVCCRMCIFSSTSMSPPRSVARCRSSSPTISSCSLLRCSNVEVSSSCRRRCKAWKSLRICSWSSAPVLCVDTKWLCQAGEEQSPVSISSAGQGTRQPPGGMQLVFFLFAQPGNLSPNESGIRTAELTFILSIFCSFLWIMSM